MSSICICKYSQKIVRLIIIVLKSSFPSFKFTSIITVLVALLTMIKVLQIKIAFKLSKSLIFFLFLFLQGSLQVHTSSFLVDLLPLSIIHWGSVLSFDALVWCHLWLVAKYFKLSKKSNISDVQSCMSTSYCPKFWRLCWQNNLFGTHHSIGMKFLNNDLLYASFWRRFYHLLCWRRLT